MTRVFLTAEWRYLAMLNYRVPPELLLPYVPTGTQLDLWRGAAYVSVVGFLFRDTRLLGVPVPFHRTFEEINLRFYVRREVGHEHRRGVTFIRELVPRMAIAAVAKLAYNEPYLALPMRHRIDLDSHDERPAQVSYEWQGAAGWAGLRVSASGPATPLVPGSEEEFITQHYWGYTAQRAGGTVEYEVRHASWSLWPVVDCELHGMRQDVYPPEIAAHLTGPPHSALLADGSGVSVHAPRRLSRVQ